MVRSAAVIRREGYNGTRRRYVNVTRIKYDRINVSERWSLPHSRNVILISARGVRTTLGFAGIAEPAGRDTFSRATRGETILQWFRCDLERRPLIGNERFFRSRELFSLTERNGARARARSNSPRNVGSDDEPDPAIGRI